MKTINEILNNSTKKDFIVENLMKSNGLYCLVARPKVGKSLFSLQLAHAIATGTIFLGLKVNPSPVLYISTEMDSSQIAYRINKMSLQFDDNFYLIEQEVNKPKLNLDYLEKKISEFASVNKGKFVIIDMFNGVYINDRFDLYNYQDMAQVVLPKYRELCSKYGITILLIHHLNKTNTTLGSTAIDGAVDGIITLKQDNHLKNKIYFNYQSRDYKSDEFVLEINDNLIFEKVEDETEELSNELKILLNYAIKKKEFSFSASEITSQLGILIQPTIFGKILKKNIPALEKEGLHLYYNRKSGKRRYDARYEEPIIDD